MKAPLFLWFAICFISVFSGCERGKCYYHNETPCGKVYGNVKKLTDTIYIVTDGEMTYPSQMSEYHFDSLNRLVEMNYCLYCLEKDESGQEIGVSINHQQVVKYRYDRDGRRVESETRNCIYLGDRVKTDRTLECLVSLDGNHEKWEVTTTKQNGDVSVSTMCCQYEENRILVDVIDKDARKQEHVMRVFDDKKNLTEIQRMEEKEETLSIIYTYNENNQLIEIINKTSSPDEAYTTYLEMDEFDNEGNWLKRTGFGEDREIQYITRRRIAYRI